MVLEGSGLLARRCATYAAPPVPIVPKITSTSNSYIKHCVKLRTNDKYRKQHRRVLLSSQNLIEEQLNKRKRPSIVALFVKDGTQLPQHLHVLAGTVVAVEDHVMKKLCGLDEVSGVQVVAEIEMNPQVCTPTRIQYLNVLLVFSLCRRR